MKKVEFRRKLFYLLYGLNFILIFIAWWITSGNFLADVGVGYALNRLGALLGLFGGSFLLFQFLLISRAKWLEKVFGHDRLTRMHRVNGLVGFFIILMHPILIVIGNAYTSNISFAEQLSITNSRPYVGLAIFALWLLIAIVISSIVIVRRNLKYETWFFVHLLNYVFLSTVVWHQFSAGAELQSGQWLRWYWIGLYMLVILNLVYYRFIRPIKFSRQNNLHVRKVITNNDVSHIYLDGDIEKIQWMGGQFAYWRFLSKEHGKEQHPFSISIEPNTKTLRLSAKQVGDYTKTLKNLKRNTKVIMDGPHGIFTLSQSNSNKFLFIAGGIGITPIRAMLGELDDSTNAVLLYSVKKEEELVFKDEIIELSNQKEISTHFITTENTDSDNNRRITLQTIKEYASDFRERDIYICGPPNMIESLRMQLIEADVPQRQIHFELFSLV